MRSAGTLGLRAGGPAGPCGWRPGWWPAGSGLLEVVCHERGEARADRVRGGRCSFRRGVVHREGEQHRVVGGSGADTMGEVLRRDIETELVDGGLEDAGRGDDVDVRAHALLCCIAPLHEVRRRAGLGRRHGHVQAGGRRRTSGSRARVRRIRRWSRGRARRGRSATGAGGSGGEIGEVHVRPVCIGLTSMARGHRKTEMQNAEEAGRARAGSWSSSWVSRRCLCRHPGRRRTARHRSRGPRCSSRAA